MHIEEINEEEWVGESKNPRVAASKDREVVVWKAKRVVVGVGARALFYPTLLYNVVRNKFQSEFRWWDRVDEFLLLGAVPFPTDVLRLKDLGVCGVITLNESYETLVPTSLYHAHGIDHLVLPTRDYLFAPSLTDICYAVNFIHEKSCLGRTTYVHCKAGRGRSTTIVLCYLVQHKQMTPEGAYDYVRSIRPRVLLASSQWQAVQDYYHHLKLNCTVPARNGLIIRPSKFSQPTKYLAFDDGSVVLVTKSDLDGYDSTDKSKIEPSRIDLGAIYKVRVVGEAALARISCLWLRCQHTQQKIAAGEKFCRKGCGCAVEAADQIGGGVTVDIHVY